MAVLSATHQTTIDILQKSQMTYKPDNIPEVRISSIKNHSEDGLNESEAHNSATKYSRSPSIAGNWRPIYYDQNIQIKRENKERIRQHTRMGYDELTRPLPPGHGGRDALTTQIWRRPNHSSMGWWPNHLLSPDHPNMGAVA